LRRRTCAAAEAKEDNSWRKARCGGGGGGAKTVVQQQRRNSFAIKSWIGAALENFLLENPKKTLFDSTYATKIGQVGRIKSGFFPTPSLTYFIQHHIH
jgi:hypothetical protein